MGGPYKVWGVGKNRKINKQGAFIWHLRVHQNQTGLYLVPSEQCKIRNFSYLTLTLHLIKKMSISIFLVLHFEDQEQHVSHEPRIGRPWYGMFHKDYRDQMG